MNPDERARNNLELHSSCEISYVKSMRARGDQVLELLNINPTRITQEKRELSRNRMRVIARNLPWSEIGFSGPVSGEVIDATPF